MEVRDAHVLLGRQKPQMFPSPRLAVSGDDVSVPRCSLQPLVLMGVCVDLLLTCFTVLAVNISAHNKTVRDAQRTRFL